MLAVDAEALWYLTRGTGLVSIILLTIAVALGIAQVRQWSAAGWPQFVLAALHRNASLLVVVFLAVHIASAIINGFAPIDWIAAVVPFQSPYRSLWLGLGTLAFDLLLALVATSLVRRHLSYRTWSLVHWTAYACWPLAFVHWLGTGTDGTTSWVLAINAACLVAVVAAITWRLLAQRRSPAFATVLAGGGGAALTALIVMWTLTGPAQVGWARKAGTPSDLLPASAATGASADNPAPPPTSALAPNAVPAPSAAGLSVPFTASFSGTVEQTPPDRNGNAVVTITGRLSDGAEGVLGVELRGADSGNGGIEMSSSTVTLGPPTQPTQLQGTVTTLRGAVLRTTLHDAAGKIVAVEIDLSVDRTTRTATGTVTATGTTTPPGGASGGR